MPCRAVVVCCFLPGFCSGEPCRAVVACWGGWGPHTPCARQIGPHPPQPTPPSRHGSLRCVWVRRQNMLCECSSRLPLFASFFPVSGFPVQACGESPLEAGGRATTSARSRRSPATRFQRQRVKKLFKTQAHPGSPLERAQSEAASARISWVKQCHLRRGQHERC